MAGKSNERPTRRSGSKKSSSNRRRLRPARPVTIVALPEAFESYQHACEYLTTRDNVERLRPDKVAPAMLTLDRMRALLDELGNPQQGLKLVHVAGSKGKGSTCEMTAAALAGCGYTVGLYTSPHLVDLRERFRIGANKISATDFCAYLQRVARAAAGLERKWGAATFFELTTAMCFCFFADQAIDVGVIEVGLGGRLDSTNVIAPEVTAITAIQLEHTQLLGDSLPKIAGEKAGIMKPGVVCLTIPQENEVVDAFRARAASLGCPLRVIGTPELEFSHRFEATPELGPHVRVSLSSPRCQFEHVPVPLRGEHQAFNCGLALAIIDALRERGWKAPERQVTQGLARTPNFGRLEQVWDRPRIIVDGAHNPESVSGLVKAIGAHLRYDSMVMIFGCASDKNVPGMLQAVARGADKIIFTRASESARAMDPKELHRRFTEFSHKMVQTAPTVKDAINLAARAVARDDIICVTGSFYVAGEAKKLLVEKAEALAAEKLPSNLSRMEPKPEPRAEPGPRSDARPPAATGAKPAHRVRKPLPKAPGRSGSRDS
ncbi:MAG: bifunctional folylpolyglutamate synthase/dihydrofolate synthase [Phycisphaerae bacterium]|nr:bifunctional folylpolyglutamate synthase/dihydrofolate synthase [Phycisphaerae bacterium]